MLVSSLLSSSVIDSVLVCVSANPGQLSSLLININCRKSAAALQFIPLTVVARSGRILSLIYSLSWRRSSSPEDRTDDRPSVGSGLKDPSHWYANPLSAVIARYKQHRLFVSTLTRIGQAPLTHDVY